MRKKSQLILAAALSLIAFSAAGERGVSRSATVTASGPVRVGGRQIPATAARALPVDDKAWVETDDSTAVMVFPELGRLVTRKDSKVKTWFDDSEHKAGSAQQSTSGQSMVAATAVRLPLRNICLTRGAIRFEASRHAEMVICARNQKILASRDAEGTVFISPEDNKVYAHADKGSFKTESKEDCGCGIFPAAAIFSFTGTAGLTKASAAGIVGGLVTTRAVTDKPQPLSASVE